MSKHKQDILQLASQYLCPGRISTWHDMGIDLVIAENIVMGSPFTVTIIET